MTTIRTMTLLYISPQAPVYGERTAIVLGFAAVALALAAFASCRTFVALIKHLGVNDPSQNRVYRRFNRYHVYYWWFFGVAVLAHVLMATFHTGWPKAGDPDAGVHWMILILGTASGIASASLFGSCRISPRLLAPAVPKISLGNEAYRSFFGYHSFYWLALILVFAGHFLAGYLHAGIWPGPG
jgi:hypothetical protein